VAGRPWPLPEGRWVFAQTWEDVLFCHWRVPAAALRGVVPPRLQIDEFDGSAWIAILPFRLTGFRLRGLPAAPRLSSFPELNVRTYVRAGDRPGILFLSLDAARRWAVVGARRLYKLPYHEARMSIKRGEWVDFSSERVGGRRRLRARYRPAGPPLSLEPGSLEYFLTERYRLYTSHRSGIYCSDAHHVPWSIRHAEAEITANTMVPRSIPLEGEPLLHYSPRQDALIWPLRRLEAAP
jgi:uncharacterized protein